jgi:iron-sulfur cluster repair protein YtfE (RIC family)
MERADQTVGQVAGRSPRALEVLQRFGINHCCGASLTLAAAAAAAGVDLGALLVALREAA